MYPVIETVTELGTPLEKVTVSLTFEAVISLRTAVAPAAGAPYKTTFWTAVRKAAEGVFVGESYGMSEA